MNVVVAKVQAGEGHGLTDVGRRGSLCPEDSEHARASGPKLTMWSLKEKTTTGEVLCVGHSAQVCFALSCSLLSTKRRWYESLKNKSNDNQINGPLTLSNSHFQNPDSDLF